VQACAAVPSTVPRTVKAAPGSHGTTLY
jgi:hypothetical protein